MPLENSGYQIQSTILQLCRAVYQRLRFTKPPNKASIEPGNIPADKLTDREAERKTEGTYQHK